MYKYTNSKKEGKVIYPELSYEIIGTLFDVWNTVGHGHKESFYQKAIAKNFEDKNISFKEQIGVKIKYRGKEIGIYFFGFFNRK